MNPAPTHSSNFAWCALAFAVSCTLAACGGGDDDTIDPLTCPDIGSHPGQVIYGIAAPAGYVGPLQAAPASVSAAAGRQMFVCP
jgi:hypothetical protein